MIVTIEITDAGRLTRVDCKLVKPKLVNAKFPKLPVPPFGIWRFVSHSYEFYI